MLYKIVTTIIFTLVFAYGSYHTYLFLSSNSVVVTVLEERAESQLLKINTNTGTTISLNGRLYTPDTKGLLLYRWHYFPGMNYLTIGIMEKNEDKTVEILHKYYAK